MAARGSAVASLDTSRHVAPERTPAHSTSDRQRPDRARALRCRLWIAGVLLVGCLSYARVVTDYFVMDDFELLTRASRTPWWGAFQPWESREGVPCYWLAPENPNPARSPQYFRPLEGLVYWGNYHLWGMWALPYHLFALLLNLGICLLVFRIARHFIRRIEFAGIAALLFAAHPAHVEVVQWVAALSDPLAALFGLLSFDAWMIYRSGGGRRPLAASLGCFGLSLLCKESAVMLPALFLLAALLLPRSTPAPKWRARLAAALRQLAPFWGIAALYLVLHLASASGLYHTNRGSSYLHSATEPGFAAFALFNLAVYLWDLMLPLPLFPIDVRDLVPHVAWIIAAAIFLLVLLTATTIRWLRRTRPVSGAVSAAPFLLLWPVVTLLPTLPVMPGQRFLYLPSAGFCWLIALGWQHAADRARRPARRRLGGAIAAVSIAYVGLANLYQSYWRIPGDATRDMVGDVRRQAASLPPGSEIYLVNLWAPAMRLPEALRLEFRDPDLRVQTLTCSPKVLPLREDQPLSPVERLYARYIPSEVGPSRPLAQWTAPHSLRLSLSEGGYGRTLVEGLASAHANLAPGTTVRGEQFTAKILAADSQGIRSVEFRFNPLPRGARRLFFECRNGRLVPMSSGEPASLRAASANAASRLREERIRPAPRS